MRGLLHPGWILTLVPSLATALAGCGGSRPAQSPPTAQPDKAPLAARPLSPPDGGPFGEFARVDLSGLTDSQKRLFTTVAAEEFCPCDCPQSLAACLQAGARCPAAPLEAESIVREIRRGIPEEDLREMMSEAFSGGFSAPPKPLVLDGYGSLGPASAPITAVVYSDFECPHCRDASPFLKEMVRRHPGELRMVFKHFPLRGHTGAQDAAMAAEAAARQGKFWEMHDKLFEHQMNLSQENLRNMARAIGLDVKRFDQDRVDPLVAGRVEASRREAMSLGINSTPTIYINGRRYGLRRSVEAFESRLAMERVRSQGVCP